jgi:DNA polymerase-3 subunit gamma/tau
LSIALARKHRPKTFAGVAVQTHVANTLKGAIARGRVAHAYLLCGPRGTGKTTLARVLAMALNCENKRADGEPCGACGSCTRIWAGATSLDVIEIDAASNRGVDDARGLRERAMYAPSGDDRFKVYIVDEAHMLTREAWNALLKILEEPPPRVVFVFATTEPQKIAQAAAPVLSRVQRFDLKRIGTAEIRNRLTEILTQEQVAFEPDALALIARAADGSMRDALSLTDQVRAFGDEQLAAADVRSALGLIADDELLALFDIVAERRAGDVFAATAKLADFGADFSLLLTGVAELLRAQLALELNATAPEISDGLRDALTTRKGRVAAPDLVRMLSTLVEHEPIFRKSGQPQMLFEALLVRFALLDRTVAIDDVLRAMGGGGSREAPTEATPGAKSEGRASSQPQPTPRRAVTGLADAEPRVATAPLADAKRTTAPRAPLDVNHLAGRWDDIVAELRAAGRGMVAQLLEEATPAAVTSSGVITLDAESELTVRGLSEAESTVIDALKHHFSGVTKLVARAAAGAPRKRYDATSVKAERTANLRKADPLLAAAIDALDLELID